MAFTVIHVARLDLYQQRSGGPDDYHDHSSQAWQTGHQDE